MKYEIFFLFYKESPAHRTCTGDESGLIFLLRKERPQRRKNGETGSSADYVNLPELIGIMRHMADRKLLRRTDHKCRTALLRLTDMRKLSVVDKMPALHRTQQIRIFPV